MLTIKDLLNADISIQEKTTNAIVFFKNKQFRKLKTRRFPKRKL